MNFFVSLLVCFLVISKLVRLDSEAEVFSGKISLCFTTMPQAQSSDKTDWTSWSPRIHYSHTHTHTRTHARTHTHTHAHAHTHTVNTPYWWSHVLKSPASRAHQLPMTYIHNRHYFSIHFVLPDNSTNVYMSSMFVFLRCRWSGKNRKGFCSQCECFSH